MLVHVLVWLLAERRIRRKVGGLPSTLDQKSESRIQNQRPGNDYWRGDVVIFVETTWTELAHLKPALYRTVRWGQKKRKSRREVNGWRTSKRRRNIYIGHLHKTNKSRTKERDLSPSVVPSTYSSFSHRRPGKAIIRCMSCILECGDITC